MRRVGRGWDNGDIEFLVDCSSRAIILQQLLAFVLIWGSKYANSCTLLLIWLSTRAFDQGLLLGAKMRITSAWNRFYRIMAWVHSVM